jgi:IclR family acetate operon transcriptional repressor
MLSLLPEREALAILQRTGLPRYTSSTLVTEGALLADLRESRRRGFAIDDGEQEVGVRCIAVAVPAMHPPVAVSISGPAARVTDAKSGQLVEALQQAARDIAQRISS